MHRQRDAAIGANDHGRAFAANHERRIAAAIEKQDALLTPIQRLLQRPVELVAYYVRIRGRGRTFARLTWPGRDRVFLTQGHDDYKPSWSRSGALITFFRTQSYGSTFAQWKTKLCVIGADGTGFRELSDGRAVPDGNEEYLLYQTLVGAWPMELPDAAARDQFLRRIQQYGIQVMAGFIVGFDNDPDDVFDKQVEFIQASAIPIAMVGLLQALPGTQLYRRLLAEGRILGQASGNNIDCNLSFVPKMDSQRLLNGYRSILKRIYAPDAYYERVRRFLDHHYSSHRMRRPLSDYLALCRSVLRQGVLGKSRSSYWKFLLTAAMRYRVAFGTAVTLAIMGHHFYMVTKDVCGSD